MKSDTIPQIRILCQAGLLSTQGKGGDGMGKGKI
jgi:hypothetical protein